MYFSQTAIVLVLLVFLTSTIYYQTVEFKTNDVKNSMEIKKMSLHEKNLENTLDKVIDKIVEDAFVNKSYEIMCGNRNFYNSADEAEQDIESYIGNEINKSLYILSNENGTVSYSIESINISPVYDNRGVMTPLYVKINYKIDINYSKKLKNGYVVALKPIYMEKEIKLSRIPDPYVYRNNFYYTWGYGKNIHVNNLNDDDYHTFCIILNNSNFNYSEMHNSSTPREIRIIGYNSSSNKWNVLIPYWVQTWKEGNDNTSVIWIRCSRNEMDTNNNKLILLYNSTAKVDRQNPDRTFELFDDFNYMDYTKWNVSGGWYINDSILTVQGLGSSVWTNNTYGTGHELVFRGNFTPVHAQAVGFFTPKSDTDGVGWDCYEWDTEWLYMRNGSSGRYVPTGNNYLNQFYIYDMKRLINMNLNFSILNDTQGIKYHWLTNSDNGNNYSISINTFKNSNATISIDWIFLKDTNNIITTVDTEKNTNPRYKELKPKTYIQTIYYGDPQQYVYVDITNDANAGNYSIIGLLTNATDSWGNCGYKPLIEIN